MFTPSIINLHASNVTAWLPEEKAFSQLRRLVSQQHTVYFTQGVSWEEARELGDCTSSWTPLDQNSFFSLLSDFFFVVLPLCIMIDRQWKNTIYSPYTTHTTNMRLLFHHLVSPKWWNIALLIRWWCPSLLKLNKVPPCHVWCYMWYLKCTTDLFVRLEVAFIRRVKWSVKLSKGQRCSVGVISWVLAKGSVLSHEHVNYRGGKVNAGSWLNAALC